MFSRIVTVTDTSRVISGVFKGSVNSLVKKDHVEVCFAFARDNVAIAQSLSGSLQTGIRFLHTPLPAPLSARLAACFPLQGEIWVCQVPHEQHWWGRPCLFSDSLLCPCNPRSNRINRLCAFWPKPVSIFGLFPITKFNSSSHMLVIPSSLAPYPPWCWQIYLCLTVLIRPS